MHAPHHDRDHHDHGHHHHAPTEFGRAFAIGIALNLGFVLAEVIYGLRADSLALLADAGHNASDVLGLVMAWVATWLMKRRPTARYTYGLQSSSILASLLNAMLLLVVTGGIAWEAMQRLSTPGQVEETTVIIVAALGILINGATAWLFMNGAKGDLNIRGAFLHMAADALVSLGVVASGALTIATSWLWLDPATSLVIAFVIVIGTWGLLRDSVNLALHAVPRHIDSTVVKKWLLDHDAVGEVHDLHIWAMSTREVALSAHLLMKDGHPGDGFIKTLAEGLAAHFAITHPTVQLEMGDGPTPCALAPDHIV